MLISFSKKFIFIHNYKVAGTSIRAALFKYTPPYSLLYSTYTHFPTIEKLFFTIYGYHKTLPNQFKPHVTALELKQKLPNKIFDNFYKFGFVRNPWDWHVSLYTYILKNKNHKHHDIFRKLKDFDEYIDWRIHNDLVLQKSFFYDNEDQCLVNFIGKFETLNEDYQHVVQHLKIQEVLPFQNKSREDGKSYLEFYNEKTLEMVNQAYKEDIDLFNYSKPQI